MKTITIRDLRQRWPAAEAALQVENEILITRDSKPVARLVRVREPQPRRPRWGAAAHRNKIRRILGNKIFPSLDGRLAQDRAERTS